MATRGSITVKLPNGKYRSVYTHWDSYPKHNGKILLENYNTQELAEELVEGGDISSLGKQVSTDLPHSFTNPQSDVTVYYHRDRGEEMTRNDFDSFEAAMIMKRNEYNYLFQEGSWYLHGKLLTQEMCK